MQRGKRNCMWRAATSSTPLHDVTLCYSIFRAGVTNHWQRSRIWHRLISGVTAGYTVCSRQCLARLHSVTVYEMEIFKYPQHNITGSSGVYNYLTWTGTAQSVQRRATARTVRVSNPGGCKIFHTLPDLPWGPSSLLHDGYRSVPGGRAEGTCR